MKAAKLAHAQKSMKGPKTTRNAKFETEESADLYKKIDRKLRKAAKELKKAEKITSTMSSKTFKNIGDKKNSSSSSDDNGCKKYGAQCRAKEKVKLMKKAGKYRLNKL